MMSYLTPSEPVKGFFFTLRMKYKLLTVAQKTFVIWPQATSLTSFPDIHSAPAILAFLSFT